MVQSLSQLPDMNRSDMHILVPLMSFANQRTTILSPPCIYRLLALTYWAFLQLVIDPNFKNQVRSQMFLRHMHSVASRVGLRPPYSISYFTDEDRYDD